MFLKDSNKIDGPKNSNCNDLQLIQFFIIFRFTKFTEQTGNKNTKKSKFKDVAGLLSEGAGNDIPSQSLASVGFQG